METRRYVVRQHPIIPRLTILLKSWKVGGIFLSQGATYAVTQTMRSHTHLYIDPPDHKLPPIAHEALLQQKKRRAERQQKEAEEIEALRSEVTRTTEAINRAERSCFALKATLSNLEKALAAAEAKERAHVQQASEISSKRIQEMAGYVAYSVIMCSFKLLSSFYL